MDITHVTVHCSATMRNQFIGVDQIREWHVAAGWRDVGYHFVIRRSGELESGRPIHDTGAHVKGHNKGNLGVCLIGGLSTNGKPEANYEFKQYRTLGRLLMGLSHIYPGIVVMGHRDWSPDTNNDGVVDKKDWMKACPCFDMKPWWSRWRNG